MSTDTIYIPVTNLSAWSDDSLLRLLAHSGALYDLAQRYASECGECAGVGITPDDEPCEDCADIRAILDAIDRPEVTP